MINHDFNTVEISDGTSMKVYVALPEGEGPFPSIFVLQEAFGVNHHIRDVAERFCRLGYSVISPDLYHRSSERLEAGYDEFPSIVPHYQALTNEGLTLDLMACYEYLFTLKKISMDKVGCVGFCLGGKVSFLANAVLPITCGVSFYGGGLEMLSNFAKDLHGPHLFLWGGLDKHITEEKRNIILKAVTDAGKDFTNVYLSYADHGFFCDERGSYNPMATKEAWAITTMFFENRLVKD